MPIEFGLLRFSFANIKLSETPQSLLYTNVIEINPVILGNMAQSIVISQTLNHYFASSNDAE
jgi:hypothetical protein